MNRTTKVKSQLIFISFIVSVLIILSGAGIENFSRYAFASPGECALDFLDIPVGAYQSSLGRGGFAAVEGAQSIFSNPANLGNRTDLFATYQRLLLDTRSEAASLSFRLNDSYSLALGAHIFEPGDIEGYSADNVKTGNIRTGDYLVRAGVSKNGDLSYGLSISYYGQRLDDRVGNGYGFGFGVSKETSLGRFSLSGDNIGPEFKIGGGSAPLPQRYSLSMWLPISSRYLNLIADLSYRRESGMGFSGGIEYSPVTGFFLRAGGNDVIPLTFGLGLVKGDIGFDYSFTPSELFGNRHIFSINILR